MITVTLLVNLLVKCAFLVAMCFCIHTNHIVMGAWCLVGAIFVGYSYSKKDNEKDAKENKVFPNRNELNEEAEK